jgi:ABC-type transport system involved in multi-copper enzyme maturation permease subunit
MTFLPIVARELRVASRRRVTYWVRTGAALAVMILGTWLFLMMHTEQPAAIAQMLFAVLTGSAVLYALLSGVRDTADCLTSEKRDGTLGLLFLTDLKGYDVVIGKLAATSLNALYSIIAVLPMFAVPLLLGGVTLGEFGRASLVALNSMFFSLSLGIFMSSISRSGRKAAIATFLAVFLLAAAPPGIGAWIASVQNAPTVDRAFLLPSPGYTYYQAWDKCYNTGPMNFWHSLEIMHGAGWACLILASIAAPRSWKDRPAGIRKLRWRERWQLWSHGNLTERSAFRKQLLDRNAFYWLAARARLKPALVWFILGLLGCGWASGLAKWHRDWLNVGIYVVTGIVLNVLLKAWLASEAGRQLAEDRKIGALELLLSTPMTVRDILRGQFLALRRQFLGPLILTLVIATLFLWAILQEPNDEQERSFWRLFWIGGMIMLVMDLVALYWVGMWQAITAKNPNRAASAGVARILILPPVLWALIILVAMLSSMNGGETPGSKFFVGLWLGLSIGVDLLFSFRARHKLLTEFRLAASQRYASRRGFFRRLFFGSDASAGSSQS